MFTKGSVNITKTYKNQPATDNHVSTFPISQCSLATNSEMLCRRAIVQTSRVPYPNSAPATALMLLLSLNSRHRLATFDGTRLLAPAASFQRPDCRDTEAPGPCFFLRYPRAEWRARSR